MSDTRKSVLLVGNFLPVSRGGHGVGMDLASGLRSCGWQVIMTSNRQARPARILDMLGTVLRRRSDFEVAQVDLFSGLSFAWAEAVSSLLGFCKKPFVLTLHGGALPVFAERWPGRVERLLGSARCVTSPSAYLAEEMNRFHSDIRVIPNGMDLSLYEFRRRTELRPRLIWLRAFHDIYRPWLAPRVLSLLKGEFPDASLVMMGPDKRDGSLDRTIDERGVRSLNEAVQILGPVEKAEVPHQLQGGDVFLNTAVVDNAPVTVAEAMACGLCVVSTDVGGVRHLVEAGTEGLLVPPDDPEAMAAAVARLLRDSVLAAGLSSNGRRRVESHDWGRVIPQWERLLREAVAHG